MRDEYWQRLALARLLRHLYEKECYRERLAGVEITVWNPKSHLRNRTLGVFHRPSWSQCVNFSKRQKGRREVDFSVLLATLKVDWATAHAQPTAGPASSTNKAVCPGDQPLTRAVMQVITDLLQAATADQKRRVAMGLFLAVSLKSHGN